MIRFLVLLSTIAVLLVRPDSAHALRCGSDLVQEGDLKIEVKLACGEPFSREPIGYVDQLRYTELVDDPDRYKFDNDREVVERIRVMAVEEWIIRDGNNYYSLIFEGNRLKTIEWVGRE